MPYLYIPVQYANALPVPRSGNSGNLKHISMPYAPPYFTPPARSRGAYLCRWRQEQALAYVPVYAKKIRLRRRSTVPASSVYY